MISLSRGEVWWANMPEPRGSEPGHRRPVLIIQSERFNRSRLSTVIAVIFSTNLKLADAPGNVLVPRGTCGLEKDSVVNVSQLFTLDRASLTEHVGNIPPRLSAAVDAGLRLAVSLP